LGKPLTPVLRFVQFEALNHGAHCPVQNDNARLQEARQGLGTGVRGGHGKFLGLKMIKIGVNTIKKQSNKRLKIKRQLHFL
jgi:hypothetical protein